MFEATKNIPKKLFVKIFHLLGHLLAVSGVGDKSSHLADDPLDALLGLEHGHVHVLHPLQHVGGGRGLVYKHTVYCLVTSPTAFSIPTDQSSNDLTAARPPGTQGTILLGIVYTEESH